MSARPSPRRRAAAPAWVPALVLGLATAAFGQQPLPPALPGTGPPASDPAVRASEPPDRDPPGGQPLPPAPAAAPERRGGALPLPIPLPGGRGGDNAPPGEPGGAGRPRPGSIFDPGATGPGIDASGAENFLGGALDPKTGWPFVLLDHFAPRPDRVARFWVVSTRDCPQVMGTDPWPCLKVRHFDARGNLVEVDPALMFAQTLGHPVFIQVQGSLTTPDIALGGLLWTHSWLQRDRAMTDETVVIAFDWPSQRVYRNDVRDINEKGRRAYVAGFHLARFVQGFPPGSRISLLGQSYGGRVVPSALHLLGGGCLNSQDHEPPVRLPIARPDLRVRAIVLAGASDHDWIAPCGRLDHALLGCEALLNLYNNRDEALRLYPFLFRSGHHHALGKVGLTPKDFERLGPLAARYEEHDVDELLGAEHTLLDAVANRQIARWMAPYLWAPDPGPLPVRGKTEPRRLGRGPRFSLFGRGGSGN